MQQNVASPRQCGGQELAVQTYLQHGFATLQCCAAAGTAKEEADERLLTDLAQDMRKLAEAIPFNRGPGRTCVNAWENNDRAPWRRALHRLLQDPRVPAILLTAGTPYFYDCGGDIVAPYTEGGDPCTWHQDSPHPWWWTVLSVLCTNVDATNGPMKINSWASPDQDDADHTLSFEGSLGHVIVRDVAAWHRASSNTSDKDRPMPSFRFCSEEGMGIHIDELVLQDSLL